MIATSFYILWVVGVAYNPFNLLDQMRWVATSGRSATLSPSLTYPAQPGAMNGVIPPRGGVHCV